MNKDRIIQKNRVKEEKGAIATFVVVTIFFFITILMGAFVSTMNLKKSQVQSDIRIRQVYGEDVERVNDIYNQIMQNNVNNV